MRDRNPEMVAGEKKKFVMRPPQVVKVGTKKTAFVNFTEIAKMYASLVRGSYISTSEFTFPTPYYLGSIVSRSTFSRSWPPSWERRARSTATTS